MKINSLSKLISNSKPGLSYNLSNLYNTILLAVLEIFKHYPYKIFLFGSFAKGMMHSNSDIDLLLIIPNTYITPKEKREIKALFDEELLDIMFNYDKEIDIKIYGEIDFIKSSNNNYFESSIIKDLILLENCVRR